MKKILIIVLGLLGFASCEKVDERISTVFLRSYVMFYMDIKELILKKGPYQEIYVTFSSLPLGNYKSTGELKRSYDALCEKNNDMTYLREYVTWDSGGPHSTDQLGVDFLSVDIISNADFNAEHPARSSLGDIVRFSSKSIKPYIDSGYEGNVYSPIVGLVSDLIPEQLILLGQNNYIGSLSFETQPTLSKSHKFTVTMTADDGRVFTAAIDMQFE